MTLFRTGHGIGSWQTSYALIIMFIALSLAGCDAFVETAGEMTFSLVEEIEERNAAAAQARIDLEPRSDGSRSMMEINALRIANAAIPSGRAKVKDAFCGSPPDLAHLPPEFFRFQPSMYIPEDTPEECRAAVDRKYPGLESCYLVFENGSTGYFNCYDASRSGGVSCMSVKRLLWEVLWDSELRQDCPEVES